MNIIGVHPTLLQQGFLLASVQRKKAQAVKFADVALYQAKAQGRNRVIRFNTSMQSDDQSLSSIS
ncbi:MAG: hypothetical protein PHT48_00715 [Dechloromonas sp.]|nr:hypothetical protein [Dechloromonas sp.]